MTVLSACQSAAMRLTGATLTALYGNSDQFASELANLANEAARDIAAKADWQVLTKLNTYVGDAVTTAFNLPADYDRMLTNADVHSSTWQTARFFKAQDLNEWMDFLDTGVVGMPGAWIILGGQMNITPTIPTGETARFYYITRNYAAGDKSAFDNDADTFMLPEHLLTLGVIWRWREMKRFEYAADLENYATSLMEAITRDRGPRIVKAGPQRNLRGVREAYPGPLG